MNFRSKSLLVGLFLSLIFIPIVGNAADYPTKPVRVIVSYAAGGGTDVIFRAVSAVIHPYLGQPLIVINKAGAGGTVGASFAAKQKPDGYNIFAALQGPLILMPLQVKTDYSLQDFEPICQLTSTPMMFYGGKDRPWNDGRELLDYAKKNPKKVRVGTTGFGNFPHLMVLKMEKVANVKFTIVNFKGNAPARQNLMGGHIDAMIGVSQDISYAKEGAIKALGILSDQKWPAASDVRTFPEMGYPELKADIWWGVVVQKGTPQEIKDKLLEVFKQVCADKSFKSMMTKMQYPVSYLGPVEMGEKLNDLQGFFTEFVKAIGVKKK